MDAHLSTDASVGERYAQAMRDLFPGPSNRSLTYDLAKYDRLKAASPNEKIKLRDCGGDFDVKKAATVEFWRMHLDRKRPLGISPVMDDGNCLWGCIDDDVYGSDRRSELLKLIALAKLPLVMCESKSGGSHLYLFLSEPASAGEVYKALTAFAAKLGLKEFDLFPSNPDGITSSQVNMPYLGEERWYIDQGGLTKTLGEFLDAAEKAKVSVRAMRTAARIANASQASDADNDAVAEPQNGTMGDAEQRLELWKARFADRAPVDLRYVHANKILAAAAYDLGRWVRDCGLSEFAAHDAMRQAWLTRKAEEGGDEATFDDIWKRQYAEGFAKGSPAKVSPGATLPYFERVQYERDDKGKKVYLIQIEGKIVQATTPELTDWKKFNDCCVEYLSKRITYIRSKEIWGKYIQRGLDIEEEIPQEYITSEAELFREQLESFLVDYYRAETREAILLGKPWEDEDHFRYVFRMMDLEKHLRSLSSRFVVESRTALGKRIRALDGDDTNLRIRGKVVNVFWVPSRHFQATPTIPPHTFEPDPL
ncbi:hypothetical protein [Phyllobacterium endophyticum]|uniref:Primase C-terminal 1 domain-containing protein n=1 Tax=Phyllobacterium endophyticum TaxID=1149773 RepID=A0A2P7ALL5_9HYPH|nr:hypothetical protein [Phyllobacterium endophyticum]MBB3236352.1 hypothetical protein [Phyllobacterium endophyticum]PSH55109.1 hypothetical protein CU100_23785 [Phyllobacterium endophyticum]TYR39888.1 hypothetical protein FY050_19905 [Phyllobacterium endophyticum]